MWGRKWNCYLVYKRMLQSSTKRAKVQIWLGENMYALGIGAEIKSWLYKQILYIRTKPVRGKETYWIIRDFVIQTRWKIVGCLSLRPDMIGWEHGCSGNCARDQKLIIQTINIYTNKSRPRKWNELDYPGFCDRNEKLKNCELSQFKTRHDWVRTWMSWELCQGSKVDYTNK